MKLRPMNDVVIIERIPEADMTAGGIVIPETAKEKKPQEAKVIAVGPGRMRDDGTREPIDCEPGDEILVGRYAGSEFQIDGVEMSAVRAGDILAVVQEG